MGQQGEGYQGANIMIWHVTEPMTDGSKNWTGARGTEPKSKSWTFDCGPYKSVLLVTREGQEWKAKKNTNTEQVLPK